MNVPAKPESPRLRDRYDRKQQEMVRQAARVFAQRGYDQTTIQELAEAIDSSAGGIYHYVGSKDQLLALICDQIMDPLNELATELLKVPGTPEEQLRELVRLWVLHVTEHRDHMLVFAQERHVIDHEDRWQAQRASRKRFERLVERLVARVHADGEMRAQDDRLAVAALLGMVNHTAQWYRPRGRLSAREIADGYVDLLLA